jgi:hypothetical protein
MLIGSYKAAVRRCSPVVQFVRWANQGKKSYSLGFDTEPEKQEVIEKFHPRNNLQKWGKQLNLLTLNKQLLEDHKKLLASVKMLEKDPMNNPYAEEQPADSPIAKLNQLTRGLLREFVTHSNYTLIGEVRTVPETDNQELIDYRVQRFHYDNISSLGNVIFAFSDNDSVYRFESQTHIQTLERSTVSPFTLISLLNDAIRNHKPERFSDAQGEVTDGVVIDPALPSVFVIGKTQFADLAQLYSVVQIEAILRKVQWEQISPTSTGVISDQTVNQFSASMDFESYYVFITNPNVEETDSEPQEDLLTIELSHLNPTSKSTAPVPHVYLPIFTDAEKATNYISVLSSYCGESLENIKLNLVSMTGNDIFAWAKNSADVGIVYNPTEGIFSNDHEAILTTQALRIVTPDPDPKKLVRTPEFSSVASGQYDLSDYPSLPFLCLLMRYSLF